MRCISCNKILNDYEATTRLSSTLEFLDMCSSCYSTIASDVPTINRQDLGDAVDDETDEDLA